MQADSFTRALEDLDPISRALVELSIRQGLDDEDIAGMLGRETADVTEEREAALRELAREIAPHAKSAPLPELESAIAAAIGTGAPAEEAPEEAPDDAGFDGEDRRETDKLGAYVLPPHLADDREVTRPHLHIVEEPEPEKEQPSWLTEPRYEAAPRRKKSDSRLKILVPLLLIVLIVAVVVGLQRSGDDNSSDTANTPAPTTAAQTNTPPPADDTTAPAEDDAAKDAEPEKPKPQALAPLAGAPDGVKGSASISDGTLTLKVSGLPEGTYNVWLFNSLIDAQQLGTSTGTKISLEKKLPADADDYQYVDISLEPADGNPNHSGESVLRVALDKLEK